MVSLIAISLTLGLAVGLAIAHVMLRPLESTRTTSERRRGFEKPVVYLYPAHSSRITVKVVTTGTIVDSAPPYQGGWHVTAEPDGRINGSLDYLYYEAELPQKLPPSSEGWIVEFSDLSSWLDLHLTQLGLNQREAGQFKAYWVHRLPRSPYYSIQLLPQHFLAQHLQLQIDPKPDTELRLIFRFTPLTSPIPLQEPLISPPTRHGFTVVEWGGVVDD